MIFNTMQPISRKFFDSFKILLISLLLFLGIDFLLGDKLMALAKPAEPFRTWHPIYHHTLKSNYDGIGHWGGWAYRVCTSPEGFKESCFRRQRATKSFDVAFIGDSFTEGLGLPYEQTFVGQVAEALPNLKIANLGVVSYSPAIYLVKLKELIARGYSFKHIVVFIDISDPYDEAHRYDLYNDSVVVDRGEPFPLPWHSRMRRVATQKLPLTGEAYTQFRRLLSSAGNRNSVSAIMTPAVNPKPEGQTAVRVTAPQINTLERGKTERAIDLNNSIYQRDYGIGEWTYNINSASYGPLGVQRVLANMEREMKEIHALAQAHGAKLSVGVYPWPGQLKYDVVDSLQVKIWRDFCETRCAHFYNAFPAFFKLVEQMGADAVIHDYYFAGDVHFTQLGNAVLSKTILDTGLQ